MFTEELKEKIENKYGSLDDECGCYIGNTWLSVKDVVELVDECDHKDELKDKLEDKYGDLDDECGCYIGNEWLSVKSIVSLIDSCDDEDDDYDDEAV